MSYTFSAQTTYTVGSDPASVLTADVDGDGNADLITANTDSDTISIRRGNGDGTFGAETTLAVGDAPTGVVVADVNRDGKIDLITSDRDADGVSVLLGLGGGAFARTAFAAGPSPVAVATTDFFDSGRTDILVLNQGQNDEQHPGYVSVLPGNGNGFFTSPTAFGGGGFSHLSAIVVADLNNDGLDDIVLGDVGAGGVRVMIRSGACFVHVEQTYAAGAGPSSVTVADVNGDGYQDIIVANRDDDTVAVLLNDRAGLPAFAPPATFATGDAPSAVASADVNGDGKADLVVTNAGDDTVSVLFGNGDGTFAPQVTFAAGDEPSAVAVADVNRDGRRDLVVSNRAGDTVSVLLGDHTFAATGVGTSPGAPATLKIGDTLTFAVATDRPITSVTPGAGGATPTLTLSNGATATYTSFDAAGLHFSYTVQAGNGEDTGDLQVTGLALNGARVDSAGAIAFAPQADYESGDSPTSVATADLNGDGFADLVVVNQGDKNVAVLLNQGDGTFLPAGTYDVGLFATAVTAADVNGDGRVDIVVANATSATVSVLAGQGDGTFSGQTTHMVGAGSQSVATADVNNDGIADIITSSPVHGMVSVLLGLGFSNLFAAQQTFGGLNIPQTATTADVNQDGWLDIVAGNWGSGTVSVLLGTGNASGLFGTPQTFAVGFRPWDVATADLNGDGWADLVVTNSQGGNISVLLGSGTSDLFHTQVTYVTDGGPMAVEIADVNGDGALDLVVANQSSRTVALLLGAGDGTFATATTYAVGASPLSVAVADVNGDLKPDVVTANFQGGGVSVLLNDSTFPAVLDASSLSGSPGTDTDLVVDATAPDTPAAPMLANDTGTAGDNVTSDPAIIYPTPAAGDVLLYATDGATFSTATPVFATDGSDDGPHTVTIRTRDAAGNESATSSLTFVLDTQPEPAPPQAPGIPEFRGSEGDDSYTAGAGAARYVGLGGIDTITFGFKLTEAAIAFDGNTVIIDGPDGSHTEINGFERYVFTDGTVNNADGSWLIDDLFYYSQYHDVWNDKVDADEHFAIFGWKEERNPNAFFDTKGYLAAYQDVKNAGVNALEHYVTFGWKEGRDPSTGFDVADYLAHYPDVAADKAEPLGHFLLFGAAEQRNVFDDGVWG